MSNVQFFKFTLENTLEVITTKIQGEALPQTLNQKLIGTFNIRSI